MTKPRIFKSRQFPHAYRVPEKDVRYPTHFFLWKVKELPGDEVEVSGLLYSKGYKKWKPELQTWPGWFYRRMMTGVKASDNPYHKV